MQAQQGNFPFDQPKPLNAPIFHLLSEIDDRMLHAASRYGWRRVAGDGITEQIVPMTHDTLVSESNLPLLADAITSWFNDENLHRRQPHRAVESCGQESALQFGHV